MSTILTARGFTRYRQAVRDNPVLAPTHGMPVSLEAGGRIIDSEASQNLHYSPLSSGEQAVILDFLTCSSSLQYVAFHARALRTLSLEGLGHPVHLELPQQLGNFVIERTQ